MSHPPLTIAITGGAGHVGSAVVDTALSDGHTVVAIDLPPTGKLTAQERYTYRSLDCMNYEAFKGAVEGCDTIIHLAAIFNTHDGQGNTDGGGPLQNEVHNRNVSMQYNALCIAKELGINRIVLASSVNSIGMVFSKRPHFDYLPVDEEHPFYPEDAYSLSKYFVELQADSFTRLCPTMRIATLRFHWVVPPSRYSRDLLDSRGTAWKDLWGFVTTPGTARSCLLGLTAPLETFPLGHETFFIVAGTTVRQSSSLELIKEKYPEIEDIRGDFSGNRALIDCKKAERLLGWKEEGFPWTP